MSEVPLNSGDTVPCRMSGVSVSASLLDEDSQPPYDPPAGSAFSHERGSPVGGPEFVCVRSSTRR